MRAGDNCISTRSYLPALRALSVAPQAAIPLDVEAKLVAAPAISASFGHQQRVVNRTANPQPTRVGGSLAQPIA